MKDIFKIIIAVALLIGASSCISENQQREQREGYKLLSLHVITPADTRGESPHVPHGHLVAFTGGYLYFVNDENRIVRRYQVVTGATPTNIANGIININSMTTNDLQYIRVPRTVVRAVIVGNAHGRTPIDQHRQIVEVNRAELNVYAQRNAENVNIWDSAPLVYLTGTSTLGYPLYRVELDLYPTVARVELSRITGDETIHSFRLRGIFIDNYHPAAYVDGTLISALNTNALSTTPAHFERSVATNAALYNWYPAGIASTNRSVVPVRVPTSGGYRIVWGYNLFAERIRRDVGNNILNPNGSTLPRIIIRLSDVRLYDATGTPQPALSGDRFITLHQLIDATTGNNVQGLHARQVYYLGEVRFGRTDLHLNPNLGSPTGISMDNCAPGVPLGRGESRRLMATATAPHTISPNQTGITWTSSNTAIATVNNGVVTIQSNAPFGSQVTITATTVVGGFTAQCTIDLPPIPATDTTDPGVVINGVRWATRNLYTPGTFAASIHSSGRFYQWGTLANVTHSWAPTGTVTGWNTNSSRTGWTSVTNPCPAGWRVPTQNELRALNGGLGSNTGNTVSTWYSNWNGTGVAGRVFPQNATVAQITDPRPTAIFLPAFGWRDQSNGAFNAGGGFYWSNTSSGTNAAIGLNFTSSVVEELTRVRAFGFGVRCVAQ